MTDPIPSDRTLILDRIEDGAFAVLVGAGERELVVPAEWLPGEASEGDVLRAESGPDGGIRFRLDADATRARLERMRELRDSIPRGPAGDLDL